MKELNVNIKVVTGIINEDGGFFDREPNPEHREIAIMYYEDLEKLVTAVGGSITTSKIQYKNKEEDQP